MRTSHLQYVTMVKFMEVNGDLSKPSGGPRSRHFIQMKWKELTHKLNSDGSGDPRPEEKWRKVWSDFKNNCKKKCAKINRAIKDGPALQLALTDLESRVMEVIRLQAAMGVAVEEVGYQQDTVPEIKQMQDSRENSALETSSESLIEGLNTPGSSRQATAVSPIPSPEASRSPDVTDEEDEEDEQPPPRKKAKKKYTILKMLLESDAKSREYARERDMRYEELQKEKLRIDNEQFKERVRQRDVELQLQGAWLELMKKGMEVLAKYINKNS